MSTPSVSAASRRAQPAPSPGSPTGPAPTGTIAPVGTGGGSTPARRQTTPTRLIRRVSLIAALTAAFGIASLVGLVQAGQSSARAAANADQVVRIQAVQSQLLRADALATSAFLVGGQESAEQRAAYDDAISQADHMIVVAADSQPADREALAALNDEIVRYAGTMEQARATNRQGLPVGAAYLSSASQELRTDAVPLLANLVGANNARLDAEDNGTWVPYLLPGLLLVLSIVAIVRTHQWLKQHFRRRVNLGVAAAGLLVIIAGAVGIGLLINAGLDIRNTRAGSLQASREASDAATAIYDAKANENLTLIARGSGARYETAWLASYQQADDSVNDVPATDRSQLPRLLSAYQAQHSEIRRLDNAGSWEQAVALATQPEDGSTTAVADFEQAAAIITEGQAAAAGTSLRGHRVPLFVAGGFTALLGLAAAAAAAVGINQRLKEYR